MPKKNYSPDDVQPLDAAKRGYVEWAVAVCKGNKSLAARRLQVERSTLYRILRRPVPVIEATEE